MSPTREESSKDMPQPERIPIQIFLDRFGFRIKAQGDTVCMGYDLTVRAMRRLDVIEQ